MAKCSGNDVLTDAFNHLGDPTQQWATQSVLLPCYQRAFRKMYNALAAFKSNRIVNTIYDVIPPYTSLWVPSAHQVNDMAEPSMLWERGNVTSGAIASTDTSSPINVTTSAAHGLSSNADVEISEVQGTTGPLGRWWITVTGATMFSLNGSVSDGSAGTGGTWATSPEKFIPMNAVDIVDDFDIGSALLYWAWQQGRIYFRGATETRDIKIEYVSNGSAPSNLSTQIGIDDCLNFLGVCTAYYAAHSRGFKPMADDLAAMCFGPRGEGDSSGGFLRDLVAAAVIQMQRRQRVPEPFRRPRNLPTWTWLS